MKRKFWQQSYLFFLFVILGSCSILNNQHEKLFKVENAYYQSWMVNEQEKGTNIFIEVIAIKQGVIFDSIAFRGTLLPVSLEIKDGVTILKGTLFNENKRIGSEQKYTEKADQLFYTYKENQYSLILKNIKRRDMKYY